MRFSLRTPVRIGSVSQIVIAFAVSLYLLETRGVDSPLTQTACQFWIGSIAVFTIASAVLLLPKKAD